MKNDLENKVSKAEKKDASDCWSLVIIEAYCLRTISPKKDKYVYRCLGGGKLEKVPNPLYDPTYKTPRKPKFCPNFVQYLCLMKDCPHLGHCDAEKEDYAFLNKKYKNKKK